MKEKMNQLFKDKLLLVMLVLGLLTIVAAAGAVRVQRGSQSGEANPYLDMEEPQGIIAQGDGAQNQFGGQSAEIAGETPIAGDSNALADAGDGAAEENQMLPRRTSRLWRRWERTRRRPRPSSSILMTRPVWPGRWKET